MKQLHLLDKNMKILFYSVLFVVIAVFISAYLINCKSYDLQITIELSEEDQEILEQRLKAIKINSYRISKLNNDKLILSLKKTSFDKNDLNYDDIGDILLSNHTYEVYIAERDFLDEIFKYIDSKFSYAIDFKSELKDPIITGKDIKKVKNYIGRNNLNEYIPSIDIKYTENGKSKNEYISKLDKKKIVIVTLLDEQFWAYGWIDSYTDLDYASQPNNGLVQRFQMIGKNYTYKDIKHIVLFSKYSFKESVKLIEVKEM